MLKTPPHKEPRTAGSFRHHAKKPPKVTPATIHPNKKIRNNPNSAPVFIVLLQNAKHSSLFLLQISFFRKVP